MGIRKKYIEIKYHNIIAPVILSFLIHKLKILIVALLLQRSTIRVQMVKVRECF